MVVIKVSLRTKLVVKFETKPKKKIGKNILIQKSQKMKPDKFKYFFSFRLDFSISSQMKSRFKYLVWY